MRRLLHLLALVGLLMLGTACGKDPASSVASSASGNAMQIPNVNCGDDPCI